AGMGPAGAGLAAALVMLSVVGSLNGGILTGPRVAFAMARQGLFFRAAGRIHPRFRTPAVSLILQSALSVALVFTGRYDQLLTYAISASWVFYGMGAGAVLVLRRRRPDLGRPYRVPGYPWLPIIFLGFATAFLVSTLVTSPRDALIGLGLVPSGLPLYIYWRRAAAAAPPHQPQL